MWLAKIRVRRLRREKSAVKIQSVYKMYRAIKMKKELYKNSLEWVANAINA